MLKLGSASRSSSAVAWSWWCSRSRWRRSRWSARCAVAAVLMP